MRVTIHPSAENDVSEAASFYRQRGSPLIASRFVNEFRRIVELIAAYPELGAPRARGLRGRTMAIFPYTVVYRQDNTEIRILVVKHDRRQSGFGAGRI